MNEYDPIARAWHWLSVGIFLLILWQTRRFLLLFSKRAQPETVRRLRMFVVLVMTLEIIGLIIRR
jgi:hypothetical protein